MAFFSDVRSLSVTSLTWQDESPCHPSYSSWPQDGKGNNRPGTFLTWAHAPILTTMPLWLGTLFTPVQRTPLF